MRRRVSTARDADEHAQNLSQWNQTYDQLSRGAFSGRITELWSGKTQVFLESTNLRLRQSCQPWSDSLWFGIPDPSGPSATIDACGLAPDAIAVRQGGCAFELGTPDDFNIYGVVIDRDDFTRYVSEVEHLTPEALLGQSAVLRVDVLAKARLCRRLDVLISEAARFGNDYCPSAEDGGQQAFQDQILGAVVGLLMTGSGEEASARRSSTRAQRWQTVARIRQYITENADASVTIPDLCRRFHMSRRTLQYCFEEVTGLSPIAFLRGIRLNGARRELRAASAGPLVSVSEIALNWGFNHFGQFSQDYRELFAELPSATLRAG